MSKNVVAVIRQVDCAYCHGAGMVTDYNYTDHPRADSERHPLIVLCSACGGTGHKWEPEEIEPKEQGQHDQP